MTTTSGGSYYYNSNFAAEKTEAQGSEKRGALLQVWVWKPDFVATVSSPNHSAIKASTLCSISLLQT